MKDLIHLPMAIVYTLECVILFIINVLMDILIIGKHIFWKTLFVIGCLLHFIAALTIKDGIKHGSYTGRTF